MKARYIKLSVQERQLVMKMLNANYAVIQDLKSASVRKENLIQHYRAVKELPLHRSMFGDYYEWFLPGEDFRFAIQETAAYRNRLVKMRKPMEDIDSFLLKLEKPHYKRVGEPAAEVCL